MIHAPLLAKFGSASRCGRRWQLPGPLRSTVPLRRYLQTSTAVSSTGNVAGESAEGRRPAQLTLYTAPHCDLCTLMRIEIDKAARDVPLSLSFYDIRDDSMPDVATWRRKYQYDIPVLHLDGNEIFRHRLKADELVQVLKRAGH